MTMPDEIWAHSLETSHGVFELIKPSGVRGMVKNPVLYYRADLANEVIMDLAEALDTLKEIHGYCFRGIGGERVLQKHAERIKQARGE